MSDVTNELTEHWTDNDLPGHNLGPDYEDIVREPRQWPMWVAAAMLCAGFLGWDFSQQHKSAKPEPQLIMFGMPMDIPAGTREIDCRAYDGNRTTHVYVAGAPIHLGTLAPGESRTIAIPIR